MLDVEWDVLRIDVLPHARVCVKDSLKDVVDVELESGGQRIRTTAACYISIFPTTASHKIKKQPRPVEKIE